MSASVSGASVQSQSLWVSLSPFRVQDHREERPQTAERI